MPLPDPVSPAGPAAPATLVDPDERGMIDARGMAHAAAFLDREEAAVGVPLVDEAERLRLAVAVTDGVAADGWFAVLASGDDGPAGYAGTVLPAAPGGTAVGDLAVGRDRTLRPRTITALLGALVDRAARADTSHLQVWMRHVEDDDLTAASHAGFELDRRLAILGRDLPVPPGAATAQPPSGVTIRAARPGVDDAAVVAVLAGAYGSGPDGGWDLARFRERTGLDWFRSEDLLVADDDGRLLGLHWLKRRDATTGEVYNLAVHPDGQGRGLGPALLHAGLRHLADVGCTQVLLWVDRANERAVRLYTSQGLTTRWEDVALGRALADEAAP